jgi:hypothetical protein
MIGMKVDPSKLFFDQPVVIRVMDKATARVFNRFGATTRLTARHSIRKVGKKGKASLPGQPPKSRKGFLRDHIYYSFNPQTKSVVIGAALFARSSWAQKTLEHGGSVRQRNPQRRIRKIGSGGEIRIKTTLVHQGFKNLAGDYSSEFEEEDTVIYCRLHTQAQADRANRLNEELYGPMELPAVNIAARPYMAPAFEITKEKLPAFWENAISKT